MSFGQAPFGGAPFGGALDNLIGWVPKSEPDFIGNAARAGAMAAALSFFSTTVGVVAANPNNTGNTPWQPINPEVITKPFPAARQQFDANLYQGLLASAPTPHGWEGQQLEVRFTKPFPAHLQAYTPIGIAAPVPSAATPHGWEGQQLETGFKKPFPTSEQQYVGFQPLGFIKLTFPDDARGVQWNIAFTKPFPAALQQYTAIFKYPEGVSPQGWWGQQLDFAFKKPFPVIEQAFQPIEEPERFPTEQYGWWNWQYDFAFTKPFPVAQQQYTAFQPQGDVPPYQPPGAGKRYQPPFDYLPPPPVEEKKAKPFRPVWDKPREGKIEPVKQAPAGPPPRPPAEVFGLPGQAGYAKAVAPPVPLKLPKFLEYVPDDPAGLDRHMRDVMDQNDAIAVLKKLGLIRDEG